jgi:uroporphyrinogen-III synthase
MKKTQPTLLIVRNEQQAQVMRLQLKQHGWHGIACPFYTIEPAIQECEKLNEFIRLSDIMICTSQSAAQLVLKHVPISTLTLPILTIGPNTQACFAEVGLAATSAMPPYGSESLLKHQTLKSINKKRILYVTGNDHRNLIAPTLRKQKAQVLVSKIYSRIPIPEKRIHQELKIVWPSINLITVGSMTQCQTLLKFCLTEQPKDWQTIPWICLSERIAQCAKTHQVQNIITANTSDNTGWINTIKSTIEQHPELFNKKG